MPSRRLADNQGLRKMAAAKEKVVGAGEGRGLEVAVRVRNLQGGMGGYTWIMWRFIHTYVPISFACGVFANLNRGQLSFAQRHHSLASRTKSCALSLREGETRRYCMRIGPNGRMGSKFVFTFLIFQRPDNPQ